MTEAQLQDALERWFLKHSVPVLRHADQSVTGISSIPDFTFLSKRGNPVAHFEVKPNLDKDNYIVSDAADHLEQCMKYHAQTNLPVFVGPFYHSTRAARLLLSGGKNPKTIGAFSSFAGRFNVGIMFITGLPNKPESWSGFQCLMRQNRVIGYFPYESGYGLEYNTWPDDGEIALVQKVGAASKKYRR